MKLHILCKLTVDFILAVGLLLLMSYELIGQVTHEWIGVCIFLLCVMHHTRNRKRIGRLATGKYNSYHIVQTTVIAFMFLSVVGIMISGVILSHHVFSFLSISSGASFARILHMTCAFWLFVSISLHIGLHFRMFLEG